MEHIIIDISKPIINHFENTTFAIGRFQALHRGHQHLFREVSRLFPNKKRGVLTFTPDPRDYFFGKIQPKILTREERIEKFRELGIDILVEFVFNDIFAQMTKKAFIETLQTLGIDSIIHGEDFRFGSDQDQSDTTYPQLISIIDFQVDGEKVSSSLMSDFLQRGQIKELNQSLNYSYFVRGNVVRGKQLARKLGFPTANLDVESEKMLPENGVYATRTKIGDQLFSSITHVGPSPTFNRQKQVVETHIIGETLELYDTKITVFFESQIRKVENFSGMSAVRNQLKRDVDAVKQYFDSKN